MNNILKNKQFKIPIFLFLIGIVLMLSAGIIFPKEDNTDNAGADNTQTSSKNISNVQTNSESGYKEKVEKQIRNFIESINGINSASVVITYENSGELITRQDSSSSSKKSDEKDSTGGERNVTEDTGSETTIYIEDGSGNKYPFIVSEEYAQARGVAVAIKGTYDESTNEKIIRALEALLNIPTHKIQVIW